MAMPGELESLESYLRTVISCAKEAKSSPSSGTLKPVLILQTPATPLSPVDLLGSNRPGSDGRREAPPL